MPPTQSGTRCPNCNAIISPPGPRPHRCLYDRLRAALGDIEPTAEQDRILRWLAGWDEATVEPIATLCERLRGARR